MSLWCLNGTGVQAKAETLSPECLEIVDAARDALGACEAAGKAKDALIEEDEATFALLLKQRNEAIASAGVGQSVPWYLWAVMGVAGGVVLTRGLR